ncbi:Uncharacterized protein ESCO_002170 [Escovopsis weberi]|uniref:Ribosome quality control complex subunit 1 n=1 Tax=Escovopsis weberi TaxID=150374 RepID=A0A0M8N7V1_ESCWE|nr:Uncharacterized protein ESCO_002170 [Escovopsis weberi]
MSSRQLRKLQKQRELEEKVVHEIEASEDEDDEEEDAGAVTRRPQLNLFAALGGGDDDDDDAGGDDDDNEDDDGKNDDGAQNTQQEPDKAAQRIESDAPTKKNNNNNNKKKKSKKGKKGKAAAAPSKNAPSSNRGKEDEIDKAIQELGLAPKRDDAAAPAGSPGARRLGSEISELLSVNTQHLKVVHEMRNLFGRDVIESANAGEQQDEGHRRGRQRVEHVDLETFLKEPAWAKKLPEISLRRNVFIQGREHWPRATAGGLTMVVVGTAADGLGTEYAYAYDKNYDDTQTLFFALVQMGDPMQMVRQLKATPYHVSMLLQVSSVAKQDQNMALAAELCERALFTFGRMTTSAFRRDIEHGKARLNFNRPENRQFWLAGYHYIKSLVRKGTYKTALEWAKLLFAMDPRDPYAMRHFIHLLAIRAHESSWLLSFLDKLGEMTGAGDTVYLQQTRVLALLQKGDAEQARSCLARGMQQVPWLYCALFQELNMDAPPSIWGISAESDSRMFWVQLYLHQAKDVWNNSQATALLLDVAKSLGRVSVADLPADDPPVDRGSVRLAFLDGQTGLMGMAPRDILESQPNYEFDPLPPPEDENIFSTPGTMVAWTDAPDDGERAGLMNLMREDFERLMAAHAELELQRGGEEDRANAGAAPRPREEPVHRDYETAMREAAEAAAAAAASGNNDTGMMAGLMRMLGMRRRTPEEIGEEGEGGTEGQGRGLLPGAWPEMEAGVYDYDEEDEAYDLANGENEER